MNNSLKYEIVEIYEFDITLTLCTIGDVYYAVEIVMVTNNQ